MRKVFSGHFPSRHSVIYPICSAGRTANQPCKNTLPFAATSYRFTSTQNRRITMGIMNFIRGQLIEIIEWTDDSRDTISFRFEDNDAEIKRGAQLIVRESQVAQFVYLGEFGD